MPLETTWDLHSVKLLHATAPVTFSQITRRTVNKNMRTVTNYSGGGVQPQFVAVMTAAPMVSFETTEIGRVLSAIGLNGAGIGDDPTDAFTGAEIYYERKQNKGTRAAGTVHMKRVCNFGLAIIRRVRAKWSEEASIEVEIYAGSVDGEISPLAVSTPIAVAKLIVDQKWTLGANSLNGVEIAPAENDLDFGKTVVGKGAGADIWQTNINLQRHAPVMNVKTFDPEMYATHDLFGDAINASHCDFYLRKLQKNGARMPDATAEHIRFRFMSAQGMIVEADDTGSQSEDVEADFQVIGIATDVQDSVAITNGIAHP